MRSILRTTIVSLALAVLVAPTSGATDLAWSPAIDLSVAGQSADSIQIKTSSDGLVQTITWRRFDGSNYIIQSRSSNDYGASWGPILDLTSAGLTAKKPQIAMSTDGKHQTITWYRGDGGPCEIIQSRTSSDFGSTWAPVLDVTASGRCAYEPRVAMSVDGRYQTITWYRGNGGYYMVQSRTSNDYGATWSTNLDLSTPGQDTSEARIAMSSDGRYQTIAWDRVSGSTIIIQSRTSNDYGLTWSTALDLSATGQTAFTLQVAMSSDGRYQTLIWRRSSGSNYVVQSTTSTNYGASWSTPVDHSATGQSADNLQIAMSAGGQHQTITWTSTNGGVYGIQSRTSNDYGATWAATLDLSTPGNNASGSQIAMSADGHEQTITWRRSNGSNYIVQVSQWGAPSAEESASSPRAIFRFVLPDGTECSAISPQVALVGTIVTLPDKEANCRTMRGSLVRGWTIPTPPGSTEYGSPATPFGPGLPVRVIDSQTFTLVPYEPILTFTYDANVALDDACASNAVENTTESGRRHRVWVPRTDTSLARFPTTVACMPHGVTLAHWNTRGDGTGTTYLPGAPLPADWAESSVNQRTLYARWQQLVLH